MPVQDDAREREMRSLFNLTMDPDRKRSEIDAYLTIDGHRINFELKSTTKRTVSTVRDFGPDHIDKWRNELHWLFAFYDSSGENLRYCMYASPLDMEPWIAEKERYIGPDIALANELPSRVTYAQVHSTLGVKETYSRTDARRIMKKQWSSQEYAEAEDCEGGYSLRRMSLILAESDGLSESDASIGKVLQRFGKKDVYSVDDARALMGRRWTASRYKDEQDREPGYSLERMTEILRERAKYVINRGSTLNNPHIEAQYFVRFNRIMDEHAATLRGLIRSYLRASATDLATA